MGPYGSELNELATLTFNPNKLPTIAAIIQKRLIVKSPTKNWRSILKTLTVVIFLLQSGSRQFLNWAKANMYNLIKGYRNFSCYDIKDVEIGEPIRTKSKSIINHVRDEEKLNRLRSNFEQLRNDMIIPGLKEYNLVLKHQDSPSGKSEERMRKLKSMVYQKTTSYELLDYEIPTTVRRPTLDCLPEEEMSNVPSDTINMNYTTTDMDRTRSSNYWTVDSNYGRSANYSTTTNHNNNTSNNIMHACSNNPFLQRNNRALSYHPTNPFIDVESLW